MSRDSDHTVPRVDLPAQSGSSVLQGFSGQEEWGRWTLGREASLQFSLTEAQTAVLQYTGYLGQMNQRVSVWLDGQRLASFAYNNGGGDKQFGQATGLSLSAGTHTLTFRSNLSSRSEGGVGFAGTDPRDLGMAFSRLDLRPRPGSFPPLSFPADLLRDPSALQLGHFVLKTPGVYVPVSKQGLTLEFTVSAQTPIHPPVLAYSLLRQRSGQQFSFSLDGQPFALTPAQPGAGLIRGQVALPTQPAGPHRLRIEARGGKPAPDSSYLLTDTSVPDEAVSFYAQQVLLQPAPASQPDLLAAVVGFLVLLTLLWHLIFGRRLGWGKPPSP